MVSVNWPIYYNSVFVSIIKSRPLYILYLHHNYVWDSDVWSFDGDDASCDGRVKQSTKTIDCSWSSHGQYDENDRSFGWYCYSCHCDDYFSRIRPTTT